MIDELNILNLIGNYAFPILICFYLLIERRTIINQLIKAINDLTIMIERKIR